MQKWKYRVVYLGNQNDIQSALNRLGAEGWELVAVDETSNVYFKRRKS